MQPYIKCIFALNFIYVTALISNIYHERYEARDCCTMKFLDWFVDEQREEEKSADSMVNRFKLFGSTKDRFVKKLLVECGHKDGKSVNNRYDI